ncbi:MULTISPECIES: neutral zinc metallopeptidase [unclassified Saccharothrix]|uniref:neutral zinc metallopeptidase n=1 Tax=unclassified Saccharothrix TaxID=2593673 RepID=UPI00307EA8BC
MGPPPGAPQPPPMASPQPPPANWGPQPGWGPPGQPYPPLPRKRNNGPLVAGVIIGVVVLGIATIGIVAATSKPKRLNDSAYSGYSSYTYSYPTTTTTTETTTTTTTTTTRSTSTSTTKAGPKAVIALGDNPIHGAGLGAFNIDGCPLPAMNYSPAGQDDFLRSALPCIEAMWKPSFQKANLPYQPVELVMVTSQITNPCGGMGPDRTAMYCEGTIYWTPNHYANEQGAANPNHPGKYLGQLAHEYGHHVQWLSGILRASGQAQYDKGGWDTPAGLDLNRRKELQATCFGGMTLAPLSHGAVPGDVISVALSDAGNRGDYPIYPNRDHGAPERNAAWVNHGFKNNETSACNTWLASAEDVS